ncbi:3-oxoacyl-ACP synthase [candidate division TA06 bacterium SM1_40]|uniref:Beta-ketoacyl-[acyl-carrier-protein] synthase III n=1 Tax=candidate division TA06 bacterium SM1_40 TaxID=1703773 RepID=A0A0S8JQM4_UNCT6|nr:MAG: 3-oxoacyl-ACP synthase [candidate division TA06 bacterium SM1_40]
MKRESRNAKGARVVGLGSAAPEGVMTNFDLEKMVETSDEWIRARTGIRERRIADEKTATSDLSYLAARKAMEAAGVIARELDGIIVATATPDMLFPATACLLQDRLGARNVAAFDLEAGCSGFIYGMAIGDGMIAAGLGETILVVGADTLSKVTDWDDRGTCVLLADGAGAIVLKPSNGPSGILSTHLASDGSLGPLLCQPAGGSRRPATTETVQEGLHYLKMKGNEVFKYAVRAMEDSTNRALKMAGLESKDVDLLVPHQANYRIIEATAKRVGVPMERVCTNIDRYGNTSAASIPLALDEALKAGRVGEGDIIAMVAFGAGFTWGAAIVRW